MSQNSGLRVQYEAKLRGMVQNEGLLLPNPERARILLSEVSPFHLENYGLMWKQKDGTYRPGTSFDMLYEIYHADRILKNFIFDYLSDVEVQLRNLAGYILDQKYGPFGYCHAENFVNEDYHQHFMNDVHHEMERANEPFARSFQTNPQKEIKVPVYVALEVITFGTLSKLVSNLKRSDRKMLASFYQVRSDEALISFFKVLTTLRNTCAHHGRLSNRNFGDACVILYKDRVMMEMMEPDYEPNPYRLFVMILALTHLLNQRRATRLIAQFRDTFETHPSFVPAFIDFPRNWEKMLTEIASALVSNE